MLASSGGVIGVACKTVQPSPTSRGDGSLAASVPSSAESASTSTTPAASASAVRLSDGCWGLDLPADPAARLQRLAERCADGMTPAAASSTTPVGSSSATLATLVPGGCVRAAAVSGGSGVELALVDDRGATIAIDRDPAFALVPPRGPACSRGPLTLRARRLAGDGPVLWQTWSTR